MIDETQIRIWRYEEKLDGITKPGGFIASYAPHNLATHGTTRESAVNDLWRLLRMVQLDGTTWA